MTPGGFPACTCKVARAFPPYERRSCRDSNQTPPYQRQWQDAFQAATCTIYRDAWETGAGGPVEGRGHGRGGRRSRQGDAGCVAVLDSDSPQFESAGTILISFASPSALRQLGLRHLGTDAPGGIGRRLVDRRPQAQPKPPPLITAGPAARGRKHGRKHVGGAPKYPLSERYRCDWGYMGLPTLPPSKTQSGRGWPARHELPSQPIRNPYCGSL